MPKIKLTYFDFSRGRGEDSRLTLHLSNVDFEDDRVPFPKWKERKSSTPFGSLPVLHVEGLGELAQANTILTYLGKQYGLHPTDPWEAAQHEALMAAAEDLRTQLDRTLSIKDPEQKKQMREDMAANYMQVWAGNIEKKIAGPFVAGQKLHVVDLKFFVLLKWFAQAGLDHIPTDVFAAFPKINGLYEAVRTQEKVIAWYKSH